MDFSSHSQRKNCITTSKPFLTLSWVISWNETTKVEAVKHFKDTIHIYSHSPFLVLVLASHITAQFKKLSHRLFSFLAFSYICLSLICISTNFIGRVKAKRPQHLYFDPSVHFLPQNAKNNRLISSISTIYTTSMGFH